MKKNNKVLVVRVATLVTVALLWLFVSPVTAFFWSILLLWAIFELDSRIIGIGALVLLIVIPLALSTELYAWMAEQLAVYVFYLLCITVFLQMLELRRDTKISEVDKSNKVSAVTKVKKRII